MKKLLTGAIVMATAMAASAKSIVIYFSHTGENYAVGNITVGNTAKVAKEIAAQTGAGYPNVTFRVVREDR